ncbi:MAG: ribonuclease HII [Candidatus Nanoarchaeia archaeon]|nr:ribonuclease HII [Candidatus Nanoarchaeia archaeon]
MDKIIGIDEAGRGPVIGPMVMAGVLISEDKQDDLRKIGVKDSKLLTAKKREELYNQIVKMAEKIAIVIISPKEIDEAVESQTLNLNWLEAIKTAELINAAEPDRAYIDCPSNNIEAYRNYLKKLLRKDVKLIVEHKADFKYSTSAAASIIAKVTRDREITKIQKRFKDPMGSGYPADPVTVEFLKKHWKEDQGIYRKSWETYKELERNSSQKTLI